MKRSSESEPKEELVRGLYEAISFRNRALQAKRPLDENLIRGLNSRVIKYVSGEAGMYRRRNVHMSDGAFTPSSWEKIPEKMGELVATVSDHLDDLRFGRNHLQEVLATSAWSHCREAKIQPFIDGNKRTSRLVTGFLLAKNDLPIIIDWEPREEYFKAFYQSLRLEHEGPFAHFLAEKLLDRYNELEWRLRKSRSMGFISEKKSAIQGIVQSRIFLASEYAPVASL